MLRIFLIFSFIFISSFEHNLPSGKKINKSVSLSEVFHNSLDFINDRIAAIFVPITAPKKQYPHIQPIPPEGEFFPPICDIKEEDIYATDNYEMTLKNCSILVRYPNVNLWNFAKNIAVIRDYLCELLIPSIKYKLTSKVIKMEFSINDSTFKYNDKLGIFSIPSIQTELIYFMKELGNKTMEAYSNIYNQISGNAKYPMLEVYLESLCNVMYKNGPFFNKDIPVQLKIENDTSFTYISYDDCYLENVILTESKIFIGDFVVSFSYALDYDINGNNGLINFMNFTYGHDSLVKKFNSTETEIIYNTTKYFNYVNGLDDLLISNFTSKFEEAVKNMSDINKYNLIDNFCSNDGDKYNLYKSPYLCK